MPDTKITALTALTTADPATDMLPIVDVSDTTMAASGTTKRISINNLLAASGTATLASATITGDLTVDTNVLKVDTTNNRVGVNNASPSEALDVSGNGFFRGDVSLFNSAGGAVVSKSLIFGSAANTSAASIYGLTASATAGQLYFATETGGVMTDRLQISDTGVFSWLNVGGVAGTGLTLNATSNLVLRGGTAGANGVGVTFPATQVASSDANCLDDYKEGTWTPVLTFATPGTLVTTYNAQAGTFTKVGRLVTVMFRLSFAAAGIVKGTASGALSITGLPYTVGSSLSYQYVDLGSTIADISTGSLALIVASGTAFSFETVSTSGTRIQRDSAALTAAAFAASNASFVTITGTFTYTV